MSDMLPKVSFLRKQFQHLNIQVDGGVGPSNIKMCAEHGANMIVSGTAIINSQNRRQTIELLKQTVEANLLKN